MHTCPRRDCTVQVPDMMFACRRDWYALSKPVRDAIWATSRLPIVSRDRINAIKAAMEDWKEAE